VHRLFVLCGAVAATVSAGCGSRPIQSDAGGGAGGGAAGANGGSGGASGAGGGGPDCTFADTYKIVDWSGNPSAPDTDDVMWLMPPSSFRYQGQTSFLTDAGVVDHPTCAPALPACHDPARIDASDVVAAIADPDVQAAIAKQPSGFGEFGIPSPTAPELDFIWSGGQFDVAGIDCPAGANPCTPIPSGIQAFVDLLRALKTQQRADPACAGVN